MKQKEDSQWNFLSTLIPCIRFRSKLRGTGCFFNRVLNLRQALYTFARNPPIGQGHLTFFGRNSNQKFSDIIKCDNFDYGFPEIFTAPLMHRVKNNKIPILYTYFTAISSFIKYAGKLAQKDAFRMSTLGKKVSLRKLEGRGEWRAASSCGASLVLALVRKNRE